MDNADMQRIQQELDEAAKRLFPGAVREAVVLQYGDDPIVEPGEVMVRLLASGQESEQEGRPIAGFGGAPMKDFQRELSERLPEARRVEVIDQGEDGKHKKAFLIRTGSGAEPRPDSELTPVMVRLRAQELEIVDTLIGVGIAANRAEAVRWALARISERPAYAQLRERTLEIERLKNEF
jgi:hypothetical protein